MSEVRVQETLHHLSIAPSFFRELLSVPVHSRSTSFAVDVRSDSVVVSAAYNICNAVFVIISVQFINDLEKDRIYSSWPKSLKTVSSSILPQISPSST